MHSNTPYSGAYTYEYVCVRWSVEAGALFTFGTAGDRIKPGLVCYELSSWQSNKEEADSNKIKQFEIEQEMVAK